MYAKQLRKVINDLNVERGILNYDLVKQKYRERALKSRIKLLTRRINILTEKLNKSDKPDEEINFSCNDFDNLDMLM